MSYKTEKMNLHSQSVAGVRHWAYSDTGAIPANTVGAFWASDGRSKGMKLGDLVDFTTGTARYAAFVSAVQAEDTGVQGVTMVLDTD
jgi:hypothetical protein